MTTRILMSSTFDWIRVPLPISIIQFSKYFSLNSIISKAIGFDFQDVEEVVGSTDHFLPYIWS